MVEEEFDDSFLDEFLPDDQQEEKPKGRKVKVPLYQHIDGKWEMVGHTDA